MIWDDVFHGEVESVTGQPDELRSYLMGHNFVHGAAMSNYGHEVSSWFTIEVQHALDQLHIFVRWLVVLILQWWKRNTFACIAHEIFRWIWKENGDIVWYRITVHQPWNLTAVFSGRQFAIFFSTPWVRSTKYFITMRTSIRKYFTCGRKPSFSRTLKGKRPEMMSCNQSLIFKKLVPKGRRWWERCLPWRWHRNLISFCFFIVGRMVKSDMIDHICVPCTSKTSLFEALPNPKLVITVPACKENVPQTLSGSWIRWWHATFVHSVQILSPLELVWKNVIVKIKMWAKLHHLSK